MGNLEEYAKSERALQNAKKQKSQHPKGWEPGLDTTKKEITSNHKKKLVTLKTINGILIWKS